MAQDEPQPSGLFSKVVKFVRNPTVSWSDLDQPELDKESIYSKQMLKEMIERKRRNDFVRRREFDQLRKLRQREALAATDENGRPSFFQSSLPSKMEDRAGTLKKIDEIEAQMSMQWWKSKDVGASTPVPLSSGAALLPDDHAATAAARHYAPTVPASLPASLRPDDTPHFAAYAPTEVSPLSEAPPIGPYQTPASSPQDEPIFDMLAALNDSLELDYDAVVPAASEVADFVHAPELEEAAIRFANGDDAGAEAAILAVLDNEPAQEGPSDTWMTLFDLYRATNQQDRFDTVGIDFATRFGRSAPAWFSMPDLAGQPVAPLAPKAASPEGTSQVLSWTSHGVLSASAVNGLQSMVKAKSPEAIRLNWAHLISIDIAAVDSLSTLFAEWAQLPIHITFVWGEPLETLVREATRSGDASVNQAWWRLRMELLRIMQKPDEFDLVALEYCVTYEVSPPSWRSARNTFAVVEEDTEESLSVTGTLDLPESTPPSDFRDSDTWPHSVSASQGETSVCLGVLSGLVLGDATHALAPLERKVKDGGLLVISCDHLMRIDFSAAGSVLNWAANQQGQGRRVEFRGLHRLVAIFFNVIGINENAKVIPRRN